MLKENRIRRLRIAAAILASVAGATASLATEWEVPLRIANGAAETDTLVFGIHPDGTDGVDPPLGEVGLPPWPPSSVYEARFLVDGTEGMRRDIRNDLPEERLHTIKWQAGDGGYPVVVRWDRGELPYASLFLSDGYGGVFIPPFNMYEQDSLEIPAEMSYVNRLTLSVTPDVSPGAPPTISPLPKLTIYAGQRYPDIDLDAYVFDPDTPDDQLTWTVIGYDELFWEINPERMLRIHAATGWTGSETVILRVSDPDELDDEAEMTAEALPGGLPAWAVPLAVSNAASERIPVAVGIHPDATDGIDPELGEVALPPWPPSSAFDARLQLPDGLTWSSCDLRPSSPDPIRFDLRWQAGDGGYPVEIEWDSELPLGQFSMGDQMGGAFIPFFDMADSTSLTIPQSLDFVNGVFIDAVAVVDTDPPVGPAYLVVTATDSLTYVDLDWSAWLSQEEHFAYYEILFDPDYFADEAEYSWDWSEDPELSQQTTGQTTLILPSAEPGWFFRIRAWDTFGNPGPLSEWCSLGTSDADDMRSDQGLRLSQHISNPFHPGAKIAFNLSEPARVRVNIYDLGGRLVWRIADGIHAPGQHMTTWGGFDAAGVKAVSGVYFLELTVGVRQQVRPFTLVR